MACQPNGAVMDILKTATDWAKTEVFSSTFFILFGVLFVAAGIGFWQLGKTDLAKAYIIPTLVAGVLLMTIGIGLVYTNKARISSFAVDYDQDASAFVEYEIVRVDATLKEYKTVVFKAIPLIIIAAALVIIFINTPVWRAISITSIAMLIVILLIDGTAHARIADYKDQLTKVEKQGKD
jgi:ABC-2 type transport system permease protein